MFENFQNNDKILLEACKKCINLWVMPITYTFIINKVVYQLNLCRMFVFFVFYKIIFFTELLRTTTSTNPTSLSY